jgi:hypothetical protein
MSSNMRKIIRAFKIDEVSAVRKPASEFATVRIMKSADNTPETGDIAVEAIRKMLDDGDFDDYAKSDYTEMLNTLAESIQKDGESFQKSFTRALETPAGHEIFQLLKSAPGSDVVKVKDAPQDMVTPAPGPARAKLEALARDRQRTSGRSFAQCYADVVDDPANRALRDAANREREIELMGSLDIFDAQRLAPAKPFPANARGK